MTLREFIKPAETCPSCGSADVWTSVPLIARRGYRRLHFCRGCGEWWKTFKPYAWLVEVKPC